MARYRIDASKSTGAIDARRAGIRSATESPGLEGFRLDVHGGKVRVDGGRGTWIPVVKLSQ